MKSDNNLLHINGQKVSYSINEISVILGVCRDTIYNEINGGRLKTFKVGPRRRFVSKDALIEYIKDRENES